MSREGVHVAAAHYLIFLKIIFTLRWSLRQPCWQTTSMRFFRAIYSFFFNTYTKRSNRTRRVGTLYIRHSCYPTEIRSVFNLDKKCRNNHIHDLEHHYCANSTTEGKR